MVFTSRVGVYICHCGINIAATVDVAAVAEFAAGLPAITPTCALTPARC